MPKIGAVIGRSNSNLKRNLSTNVKSAAKGRKIFKASNPVIEIENPQFDVHEYVGIESGKESYVSFPANRVNIPEVRSATGEFVYNYFTKDERVKGPPRRNKDKVLDLQTDFSSEIFFQLANDKLPRFVKLDFEPPKTYGIITKVNVARLIQDNLDKLTVEGASSNKYYTGIEFIDTGKETDIYSMLDASAFISNIQPEQGSRKDAADLLYDTLEEKGGLFGKDKKLLKESLSNFQAAGYTLAQSDVPPSVGNFSSDAISMQSFSVQFSNLCMSEAVNSAIRLPDTVFQDEMNGLAPYSSKIKSKVLKSISPSKIDDADYEMVCKAVSIKTINSKTMYPNRQSFAGLRKNFRPGTKKSSGTVIKNLYDKYPKIKLAGYIIGKYEVLANGTTEFIGNLYSDNPNGLFIVDDDVRYGGNYVYKIRTICEVQTIVRTSTKAGDKESLSSFAVATVLVASEGKTVGVNCTEDIPPPPPENLRVGFNYRQKVPFLSWQFPLNVQRDIKRFQIFKRRSVEEPFTLIAEYDFDDSVIPGGVAEIALEDNLYKVRGPKVNYLDTSFEQSEEPIYAIASVDAHGMSSNYSAQISVKYNRYLNKITTKLISVPNAPKPYPNLLINVDAFQDAIKVSGYNRMKVFFTPEYYKVYKNSFRRRKTGRLRGRMSRRERSLEFLRVNPNEDTYQIHLLNMDLQKDEIVKIKIADKSGSPLSSASPADFSVKNLSFEFGV